MDREISLERDDATEQAFIRESSSLSLSNSAPLPQLALISRLCNGAKFQSTGARLPPAQRSVKGDPTDTAVLRFAEESLQKCFAMNISSDVLPILTTTFKKIFEIPFNSRNKWMMSVVQERKAEGDNSAATDIDRIEPVSEPWMLIKGAPDVLFPSVSSILHADGVSVPFDAAHKDRLLRAQAQWSSEGQRVIAVCKRSLDGIKLSDNENELDDILYSEIQDLTLVGLISIRDPPRAEVKDAVQVIRAAGIRIFMVTGDFMLTAVAIAKQVRCFLNSLQWLNPNIFSFPFPFLGRNYHSGAL